MFHLKRWRQLRWVQAIVFASIGRAHDFNIFKAWDGTQERILYVHWKRRTHTLNVHFICPCTFRFNKELMAFFIGKAYHLIFDRRAVTRANAFDFTTVHRSPVNIAMNDFVRFFISIGQPTYIFITINPFIHEGKCVMMCIAFLNYHIFEV